MSEKTSEPPRADIQIVDDNPENLDILAAMINKMGYNARLAINGVIALKSIRSHPPDIILLDILMPIMDGYEVCRRIKSEERTRDIPVIFISGLNDVVDKVKGFSAGGVDYITKPFQPAEVFARLETHLLQREVHKRLEKQNAALQREIVQRERAEGARRERDKQRRTILDGLPDHI
ncbi:MAG: response regulator, partial [Desulfobacterales bacterium]|nr:response regulator [Desulfobacterales bacterium]